MVPSRLLSKQILGVGPRAEAQVRARGRGLVVTE